jgi:hypothetical protein
VIRHVAEAAGTTGRKVVDETPNSDSTYKGEPGMSQDDSILVHEEANIASLPADDPRCLDLLHRSLAGDPRARDILLTRPPTCALRIKWNEMRRAGIARWIQDHGPLVNKVYRSRLRVARDEVEDGTQSFWMQFTIQAMDLKYDPAIATEAVYIRMLATRNAINQLIKLWTVRRKIEPSSEGEMDLADPETLRADRAEGDPWLTNHISRLVASNRLNAHEALLLVLKEWASLEPATLAQPQYLERTLDQLCEMVSLQLGPSFEERDAADNLLLWLHQQLTLPPERPSGQRKLGDLLKSRESESSDERRQGAQPEAVLQYWLDQARRVCRKGIKSDNVEERRNLAAQVESKFRRALKSRWDFLIRSLTVLLEPIKLLVWGWRKMLNITEESFLEYRCLEAARSFVIRIDHLLPDHLSPPGLAEGLAGAFPDQTVHECLDHLGVRVGPTVDAVEERYRRSSERRECML